MGLDVSHDAWSGAYSAFDNFRAAVCEATGGRWHDGRFEVGADQSRLKSPGLWAFFTHSDCDGEIEPEIASLLADEMELLLPRLDKLGLGYGHIARDRGYGAVARQFIEGCRAAAAADEPLRFA